MKRVLALVLLGALAVSCNRQVMIDSDPSGAVVRVNGQVRGTTPFRTNIEYTAFSRYEIVLEKEGYRTATTRLPMELDPGALICGTMCWPMLLVVQKPSHTVFVLEKAGTPGTNPVAPATPPPDVETSASEVR